MRKLTEEKARDFLEKMKEGKGSEVFDEMQKYGFSSFKALEREIVGLLGEGWSRRSLEQDEARELERLVIEGKKELALEIARSYGIYNLEQLANACSEAFGRKKYVATREELEKIADLVRKGNISAAIYFASQFDLTLEQARKECAKYNIQFEI